MFPVKVISLTRSLDRRETFRRVNKQLSFEFFDAVDGGSLDLVQLNKYFVQPLNYPSLGAYGCALSHLQLWNECIAMDSPLTVLEDDAIVVENFNQLSYEMVSSLGDNWDILVWGWNFDAVVSVSCMSEISTSVMVFNQTMLRDNAEKFQKLTLRNNILSLDKLFGTIGYTISPKGAKKFKESCFPVTNFEIYVPGINRNVRNMGIDVSMSRVYSAFNSFVSFPPLVITKNEKQTSLIQ